MIMQTLDLLNHRPLPMCETRESDDSSQTNSSMEIWIINLRLGLGFWGWGFRILGLGRALGTNSHGFYELARSVVLRLD